jgi:hypothetical protein
VSSPTGIEGPAIGKAIAHAAQKDENGERKKPNYLGRFG